MKILGKNIKVILNEMGVRETLYGSNDSMYLTIYINKNLPTQEKEETLLHEILHHISNSMEIGLNEKQVSRLSACLYSVFRENGINWRLLK